jgi:streptogramin lyase
MRKLNRLFLLVAWVAIAVVACSGPEPTPTPTEVLTQAPTEVPTTPPTPTPIGRGAPVEGTWYAFTAVNDVSDLAFHDGLLWAATDGGVVAWDVQRGSYVKYTTADGLAGNNVQAIAVGPDGTLWFGTYGDGVSRYDPVSGAWRTFSKLARRWCAGASPRRPQRRDRFRGWGFHPTLGGGRSRPPAPPGRTLSRQGGMAS